MVLWPWFPWRAVYLYVYILTLQCWGVVGVQRLEAAKQLLDADLISAGDYEATKAKLLSKLTDDDAWN